MISFLRAKNSQRHLRRFCLDEPPPPPPTLDRLNHFGHGGKIFTKKEECGVASASALLSAAAAAEKQIRNERERDSYKFRARSIGQRIWCIRRRRSERSRGQCYDPRDTADLSELVRKSTARIAIRSETVVSTSTGRRLQITEYVQGDPLGCLLAFVDIETNVPSQYM